MRRLFSAMRARRSASYSAMAAVEGGRGVCWLAAAIDLRVRRRHEYDRQDVVTIYLPHTAV